MRPTILPIDMTRLAKNFPKGNAYIYFLILGDTILYVGQTKYLEARIKNHRSSKKIPFSNYIAIVAPWNNYQRSILERAYIEKFRPAYNTQGKSR